MLIQMIDGGVLEIYTDTLSMGGCETCDYGSSYVNEFEIEMTKGTLIVKIDNMYSFAVSEDYMLKLFLLNLELIKSFTENEFIKWIEDKIRSENEYVNKFKFKYKEKK